MHQSCDVIPGAAMTRLPDVARDVNKVSSVLSPNHDNGGTERAYPNSMDPSVTTLSQSVSPG